MSTAKDQFDTMVEAQEQSGRAIEARAKLQNCIWTLQQTNSEIQAIADAGALNLLDLELKVGLNQIWTKLKECQSEIEALGVYDLI